MTAVNAADTADVLLNKKPAWSGGWRASVRGDEGAPPCRAAGLRRAASSSMSPCVHLERVDL